ncbi:MAG: hypothetical protein AAGA48_39110 [Myxococcota bacterium]
MNYFYVGPPEIRERVKDLPHGALIRSPTDALQWLKAAGAKPSDVTIATWVVDAEGGLRLADRHSEHVACAGGGPVRSAGEIGLSYHHGVDVVSITNQSTGFCPEPRSWPAVADALRHAGLEPPNGFDPAFEFRRCPSCHAINLIKDDHYFCGCGAELPRAWNFLEEGPLTDLPE